MAQAARKQASKQAPKQQQNTGPVVQFNGGPDYEKVCKRDTARSRTAKLAEKYHGRPVAELQAAWEAEADAGRIHVEHSKFTKGTSKTGKRRQDFSGWLGFLTKKTNLVTLVDPK